MNERGPADPNTSLDNTSLAKAQLRVRAKADRGARIDAMSNATGNAGSAADVALCRGLQEFLVERNQPERWTVLFAAMPGEPQLSALVAMFAGTDQVDAERAGTDQVDAERLEARSLSETKPQEWPMQARFALTRTPSQSMDLTLHPWESTFELHRYGFAQPTKDSEIVPDSEVGVVLVPGLAFDRNGGRLGFGAGYYDRLLQRIAKNVGASNLAIVGISDGFIVDNVPMQDHDVSMTHLATSDGVKQIKS